MKTAIARVLLLIAGVVLVANATVDQRPAPAIVKLAIGAALLALYELAAPRPARGVPAPAPCQPAPTYAQKYPAGSSIRPVGLSQKDPGKNAGFAPGAGEPFTK